MDKSVIAALFDERIKSVMGGKVKNHVLQFVLKHERKDLVIDNALKEIRIAELNPRIKFGKEQLQEIVYAIADSFAKNAVTAKEHELTTAAERARMIDEASKMEQFKAEQEADEKAFHEAQTKTTIYMND